jgi:hypothetical protein
MTASDIYIFLLLLVLFVLIRARLSNPNTSNFFGRYETHYLPEMGIFSE